MEIFVREYIKEETKACDKNFSCLSDDRDDLCKVLSCVNNDIHFVLCSNTEFCSYQRKKDERFYCECPIRKEIYYKYKK